jgi:hypothetical protein
MATNDDDLLRDYTRVRLDADEQVIEVGVIDWHGPHTPQLTWVEAARLPKAATAEEVERARRKLLQRRKFFVICKECGERNAKGHTSEGVCHGCMEKSGVVF